MPQANNVSQFDQDIMDVLVKLGQNRDFLTRPNPPAVAGLVQDGVLVEVGLHNGPGTPHAEADLINKVGARLSGGTVYVTLEPCTHWGANPPCCDQLIAAGVQRVVYPFEDPNPLVRQRSARHLLKEAGIAVTIGPGAADCLQLNREFLTHIQFKRPYMIGKVAISLDGKIALSNGVSKYISGPAALDGVHQIRATCDGILVGINTVLQDNPSLSVRRGFQAKGAYKKIILDSAAATPVSANLFRHTRKDDIFIIVGSDAPANPVDVLATHATIIQLPVPTLKNNWKVILDALYNRGLYRVLVEGGSQVIGNGIDAGVIDELVLVQSPILIGGSDRYAFYNAPTPDELTNVRRLHHVTRESVGDDQFIRGYLTPHHTLIQPSQGAL